MKNLFALLLSIFRNHQSSSLKDDLMTIRAMKAEARMRAVACEKGLQLAMHSLAEELGHVQELRKELASA